MTITIRTLKRRPGGRESLRERVYPENAISIGRDAANDLSLADLRLSLRHAKLSVQDDGRFSLELFENCSALINKRTKTGGDINLKPGSTIRLGRFELRIDTENAPGTLSATLEQMITEDKPVSEDDEFKVFSPAAALPSKRVMSWYLTAFVLAFFLALPVLAFYKPDNKMVTASPVQADLSWNSGPISMMHANLQGNCGVCHEDAFTPVQDKACLTCHEDTPDHADAEDLKTSMPAPTEFESRLIKVADMFGRDQGRCVSCHVEHNTETHITPTLAEGAQMCMDCHAGLKQALPNTNLLNASSFSNDHPQFRPTIITKPDFVNPVTKTVSLDDNPKGFSGLKFPHDMHLDATNAVAQMARRIAGQDGGEKFGFSDGVDCADCHRPEAGGALFEPVNMQQDCAMCHSLVFEDDNGYPRTLRHGEPEEVIASMRDFYLAKALANIRDAEMNSATRRRPGSAAAIRDLDRRELAFAQADIRTAEKVNAIFSDGGACFDCHVIDRPRNIETLDFKVRPISVSDQFYFKSPFHHSAHEIEGLTCGDCHSAQTSKTSDDILLPKIEVCRDCHISEADFTAGHVKDPFEAGVFPTSCLTCHSYHNDMHGDQK